MSILSSFLLPHPPLIIPEVGKGQETGIQSTITAYHECARRIAQLKPETIVLTTPHSIMYQDYFHISPGKRAKGNFGNYNAKEVQIKADYDMEFVSVLEYQAQIREIFAGTMGEREAALDHGTMIPLYFINQYYQDYQLVRIGLSGLSADEHYRLGMTIRDTAEELNRRVVFIASGDLSHKLLSEGPYGYAAEGVEFDRLVTEAVVRSDFLAFLRFSSDFLEKAAECGLKSLQIMAGAFDRKEVESELLSYEGPFGVGYGVASFRHGADSEDRAFLEQYLEEEKKYLQQKRESESIYVKLARQTLEHYVRYGKLPETFEALPEECLREQAGTFVSIKKKGNLRGCIGTILPTTENIAEEIKQNAVSAGTKDPRFDAISIEELEELEYHVDILTEPEPVSGADDLDVKKYGVIVSHGNKRGLLLPDLGGVDTVEEQIRIAKQKAGIRNGESVSLARFEVVRYL